MENTPQNTDETVKPVLTALEFALSTKDELQAKLEANIAKFRAKGTASAVARARKAASALAKHLKVVRKELQLDKVRVVAEKRAAKAAAKAAVVSE